MKKMISLFILVFVLSISVFADGDIPLGGKSCPSGQSSCFVAPESPDTKSDNLIYKEISEFLKFLFG